MDKHTSSFNLIHSVEQIEKFVELWKNKMPTNAKMVVALIARRKYVDVEYHSRFGKLDSITLAQEIIDPEALIWLVNSWNQRSFYNAATQSVWRLPTTSYVVYVSHGYVKEEQMLEWMKNQLVIDGPRYQTISYLVRRATLKNLHRGFTHFDFDIAQVDEKYGKLAIRCYWKKQFKKLLHPKHYRIIHTRGGMHLLVDSKQAHLDPMWYKKISALPGCDYGSDQPFLPLPGTMQSETSVLMHGNKTSLVGPTTLGECEVGKV